MTDANKVHQSSSRARKIPAGRLEEIERRILGAEAPASFVRELAAAWLTTTRQVWKYVARVRAKLAERAKSRTISPEADAELVRALALESYRVARKGTEKGPDSKGMVAAVRLLAEITGNAGPRRVEISGPNGGPVQTHAAVVVLPELDNAGGSLAPEPRAADPVSGE